MALPLPTPDALPNWVDRLPPRAALYARLARFDRPAGIWLLFWPCLIGAFVAHPAGWWPLWPLFLVGAVAMRSAGCVWNDIIDRDLDARVARTAGRPVASGAIAVPHALAFLVVLSLIGLLVLLALPRLAQLVALAALVPVTLYPYMKRISWWPQAWLGLTFNWGIPVGWAAADAWYRADWPVMVLAWAAALAWTLGYDSIYAAQDVEDDALAGAKSSARRLGARLKPAVGLFYLATILLFAAALFWWRQSALVLLGLVPAALHLAHQWRRFDPGSTASALAAFRMNATTGGLLALAAATAALHAGLDAGALPS